MGFEFGQKIIDKIRGKKKIVPIVPKQYDLLEEKLNLLDKNLYLLCDDYNRINEFKSFMQNDGFLSKYKRLIKGLPKESIGLISKILNRVLIPLEKRTFLVDDKEKQELRNMEIQKVSGSFKVGDISYFEKYVGKGLCLDSWSVHEQELNRFKSINEIKNRDIIDVGAYIGDTAMIFSEYTNKKVWAFEPVSNNFKLLKKNIELNNLTNVSPQKFGLGPKAENIEISINGGSSKIGEKENTEKIEIITLDDFVKENNLNVGLIKVDVEGYEQEFLKGAMNTIKTQKPALLLSIYHNPADFFEIKPMLEDLNLGYEFQVVKSADIYFLTETMLYAEVVKN